MCVKFGRGGPVRSSECSFGFVKNSLRVRPTLVGVANGKRDARYDRAHERLTAETENIANISTVVPESLRALDFVHCLQVNFHPVGGIGEGGFLG